MFMLLDPYLAGLTVDANKGLPTTTFSKVDRLDDRGTVPRATCRSTLIVANSTIDCECRQVDLTVTRVLVSPWTVRYYSARH